MSQRKLREELDELKNHVQKMRAAAVQPIISGVEKEAYPIQSSQNSQDQQGVSRPPTHIPDQDSYQGQPVPPQLPAGILGLLSRIPEPSLQPRSQLPTATVSPSGLIATVGPLPPAAITLQQPSNNLIDMFSKRFSESGVMPVTPVAASNLSNHLQNKPNPPSSDQPADPHAPKSHKGRAPPTQHINNGNTD